MCLHHYKRARAGKLTQPEPGDPSGFGRYGVVERTEDVVLCHECGGWFEVLGSHVRQAHMMNVRQYKLRHGLPLSQGLMAERARREWSQRASQRVGSPAWRRLEAARDPAAAAAARTEESFVQRGLLAVQVARANGVKRVAAPHPCRFCGMPLTGRRRTCDDECLTSLRSAQQLARIEAGRVELNGEEIRQLREAADPETLIRQHQLRGVRSIDLARALGRQPSWFSATYPRPAEATGGAAVRQRLQDMWRQL